MKRLLVAVISLSMVVTSGAYGAVAATGGTVTNYVNEGRSYAAHIFTTVGISNLTVIADGEVEVLVVGGGGGGGETIGGGGGGGGLIYSNAYAVSAGVYSVTVGDGGLGGDGSGYPAGNKGGNSVFGTLTAVGGGAGGGFNVNAVGVGGSAGGNGAGGGARAGYTASQGKDGGGGDGNNAGGGGGGAAQAGAAGVAGVGGKGGNGQSYDLAGMAVTYAGGGGGGTRAGYSAAGDGGAGGGGAGGTGGNPGSPGVVNTGGGGGGGGFTSDMAGGKGGSGIVIVRYVLDLEGASVVNGPVTNILASSAFLTGSLSSTGASATAVTAYWGTSDGGTNAGSWAASTTLDAPMVPGALSILASGLSANLSYYYRFSASNDAGVVWAPATASFITGEIALTLTSNADESTLSTDAFTVTRPGTTTNESLTVAYAQTGGSATSGVDFVALSGNVIIPAGADSADIVVTPLKNYLLLADTTLGLALTGAPAIIGTTSNATLTIFNEGLPSSPTNTWVRSGADPLASAPANWSLGHAPTNANAIIYLGPYATAPDMTWDLTNAVAGWVQTSEYTGTVSFTTTFPGKGFPVFSIAGDAKLAAGTWTHTANPAGNAETNRLSVSIGGDFTLGTNAFVNVDGKGFAVGAYGPGKGGTENYAGYGASYGGWDAERQSAGPYGSVVCPTNLGSSSGARAGGGAVLLEVAGHCQIDGTVSSIGLTVGPQTGYNAGSGGSILLRAATLAGNGLLTARGGNGFHGGAAGGGRVAIILSAGETFGQVRVVAPGGTCNFNGTNYRAYEGSAGTVYLEHSGHEAGKGILVIAEQNSVYRYTMPHWPVTEMPKASAWNPAVNLDDFSLIVITNGGNLGIVADTTMTNWSLARLQVDGAENSFITVRGTNGVIFPPQMTVSNYSLQLDVPVAAAGDWRIASSGNLSHTFGNSLNLALDGNLMVDAGGMISAHRRGYLAGGPGGAGANYAAGPSHGGRGGVGYTDFRSTYGSILSPTNWGSQNNMRGGGAIRIDVSSTLTLNGSVDANGDMTFPNNGYYGSGTGGSAWLKAGTFAGSGTISAAGGNGYVGPGGGGRISLVERAGSGIGALIVDARGGYSAKGRYSAPGTIYRQSSAQAAGAGTVTVQSPVTWTPGVDLAGTNTYCELPPATQAVPNELKQATLRIEKRGRVGLSADLAVGDLLLVAGISTMPQLLLNGHTLKVNSYYHKDWGDEDWVVYDGGQIVWKSGTLLIVK